MELVTGRKGTPHITSQQDRMKNQGIWGDQIYILNTGQMLEPQVQSSNEIRIRDGALMAQGALSCVKVNSYDSVTIQNGSQGMKRIDLICWQYTYDADQDVESAEWVVIQGTPAASDPQQPTYTEGDIQQGDELVQVPIFAVHLDGINVTGVDVIPEVMPDIPTLNADLADWSNRIQFGRTPNEIRVPPNAVTEFDIELNTPFPDTNYIAFVNISTNPKYTSATVSYVKEADKFTIRINSTNATAIQGVVDWIAIHL